MNSDTLLFDKRNLHTLTFSRSTEAISTDIDNETVILNISAGLYSNLNHMGTTIWNILEKSTTFHQILDQLVTEYEVSRAECSRDLVTFLKELYENNLLTVQSPNETK
ncbi:hypothetical protein DGMP_03470 [Desulfomarina profundi]|uniref:PqqD family protein n=1 Tax=Desulfomarina profundi TaxID=2772557 RepID=A0A8D5FK46_9BACT|nr:lasso peptide biosynthesis PqqD family chaperone [Desulfomarina profundi]BCL59654.1 hypothetical protein DGMP_03470 [Desulfomarina profundi]